MRILNWYHGMEWHQVSFSRRLVQSARSRPVRQDRQLPPGPGLQRAHRGDRQPGQADQANRFRVSQLSRTTGSGSALRRPAELACAGLDRRPMRSQLPVRFRRSPNRRCPGPDHERSETPPLTCSDGAEDGIRTHDPHLGKVMRYHCATSALGSLYRVGRPGRVEAPTPAFPPAPGTPIATPDRRHGHQGSLPR